MAIWDTLKGELDKAGRSRRARSTRASCASSSTAPSSAPRRQRRRSATPCIAPRPPASELEAERYAVARGESGERGSGDRAPRARDRGQGAGRPRHAARLAAPDGGGVSRHRDERHVVGADPVHAQGRQTLDVAARVRCPGDDSPARCRAPIPRAGHRPASDGARHRAHRVRPAWRRRRAPARRTAGRVGDDDRRAIAARSWPESKL